MNFKIELNRLNEELLSKDKLIANLNIELNNKEELYTNKITDLQIKLEDKSIGFQNLIERYEKMEKEYLEIVYRIINFVEVE